VLWGARSFHQREEVETLRAALNAIEWLDDELSVYAALRGSLFAIPDSLLLRYFSSRGFRGGSAPKLGGLPRSGGVVPPDDPVFEPIESALTLIRDLHRRRNWRSAVETVNELLEKTRAHAGFALRPAGNQVLANVYRVCDLARAYEFSGAYSFRGFVEHLNAQAENEDSAEAPVLEEGAEGVRVMTVHAAKGLEFPIVILADVTANIAQRNPDKHVDGNRRLCASRILNCSPWDLLDHEAEEHARDEAEGVRVAYVAATRARDLLVVAAVGDEQRDGWLKPLNKALYPARGNWRSARVPSHCPAFGSTSVMRRPVEFDGAAETSVQPGLHRPEQGDHEVIWWDPSRLKLEVEPSFGLRQEDILRDDPSDRAAASINQYESWKTERDRVLTIGAKPSLDVFIATDAIEPPTGYAEAVRITRVSRAGVRPHGPRFGSLVHLILRDVDYEASGESIERIARTHARLLAAPEDEIRAAIQAVSGCLRHPLIDLVRKSPTVYREYPLVVKTEHGSLLDAVIDLAFKDESGWIVVDFKTDAEDPGRLTKYRRQVGWYTYGLGTITGQRTTGWLLHV
jgi:ATP-dependent exoDNAse (exonuclease V) beta subunit